MELLHTASVKKDVGTRGAKEILLVLLPTRLQQPVSIKVRLESVRTGSLLVQGHTGN